MSGWEYVTINTLYAQVAGFVGGVAIVTVLLLAGIEAALTATMGRWPSRIQDGAAPCGRTHAS